MFPKVVLIVKKVSDRPVALLINAKSESTPRAPTDSRMTSMVSGCCAGSGPPGKRSMIGLPNTAGDPAENSPTPPKAPHDGVSGVFFVFLRQLPRPVISWVTGTAPWK